MPKEEDRDFTKLDVSSKVDQTRILYRHRAIILVERNENKRYLVVSDLHLGFEEKFRGVGISIESKIDKLTDELLELVEREKITDLLINGDVKSGTDRITRAEWDNVPSFFERMLEHCRVTVIPGNHDGGLQHLVPQNVNILDSSGALISDNLILHGHTRPLPKFQNCKQLIMGHIHPIFQRKGSPLSGQPVWVFLRVERKRIFKEVLEGAGEEARPRPGYFGGEPLENELRVIFMPSFNLELVIAGSAQDTARQERKIAPILRDINGSVSEAVVATLDGDLIGDSSLLKNIL